MTPLHPPCPYCTERVAYSYDFLRCATTVEHGRGEARRQFDDVLLAKEWSAPILAWFEEIHEYEARLTDGPAGVGEA